MRLDITQSWDGTQAVADEVVRVTLSRCAARDWILEIDAPFHGDPPPPGPAGSTPGLWDYEAVELFLLAPPDHYLEVEIGPHGHFWMLALRGVRRPFREGLPLDLVTTRHGTHWQARARIGHQHVPTAASRVNAYALHGQGAHRRFLAFQAVPGSVPDFHRLERFVALAPELRDPEAPRHR